MVARQLVPTRDSIRDVSRRFFCYFGSWIRAMKPSGCWDSVAGLPMQATYRSPESSSQAIDVGMGLGIDPRLEITFG